MGVQLAAEFPVNADLVIGVPDSATPAAQGVADILIFSREQAGICIEDRDVATESTHRLRQFNAYVATADYKKMFGNAIEFECFDVGERLCFRKSGY